MKKIVCFSGGHSSALAAIETARKYGTEGMILLNHDISPHVEHEDIKRFKRDVAEYIGLPIAYANAEGWEELTPIQCMIRGGGNSARLIHCTRMLKTAPFYKWLEENAARGDWVIYGFDAEETNRMMRRSDVMNAMGYKAVFPLAEWERTIQATEEVGIERPSTYATYKHANCVGCLKAGKQHWYCVYCLRPDIWAEAVAAEEETGYSIIKGTFLKKLEPEFREMRDILHIVPTDKTKSAKFWKKVRETLPEEQLEIPCDCFF